MNPASSALPSLDPASRQRFKDTLSALTERILTTTITTGDGGKTWRGPVYQPTDGTYHRAPVGPHLYGGTAGIALALAAVSAHCDGGSLSRRARNTALATLRPLRALLAARAARSEQGGTGLGVGGFSGLGGFVYALVRSGLWLDRADMLDEAHDLTVLFTDERVAADRIYDVMTGSAGGLLSMLILHTVRPGANGAGDTPLDVADRLGRHLLASRTGGDEGPRAWPTHRGKQPLTGFSHGASGIGYALARLGDLTGRQQYLQAAEESIAFERQHYVSEYQNWRDLRHDRPAFGTSWCHGAPGIALARSAIRPCLDDPEIERDARLGLSRTFSLPLSSLDHLCCGNVGRAAILVEAARRLEDSSILDGALSLLHRTLDRTNEEGTFAWGPDDPTVFAPSLMTGAAGVTLSLLRLVASDTVPSVLLLE